MGNLCGGAKQQTLANPLPLQTLKLTPVQVPPEEPPAPVIEAGPAPSEVVQAPAPIVKQVLPIEKPKSQSLHMQYSEVIKELQAKQESIQEQKIEVQEQVFERKAEETPTKVEAEETPIKIEETKELQAEVSVVEFEPGTGSPDKTLVEKMEDAVIQNLPIIDYTSLSFEEILSYLRRAIKKGIFSRAKSPVKTLDHLRDRILNLVGDNRFIFIYVTAPTLKSGLWISKERFLSINQDSYTDLGEDTLMIDINRNINDDEVEFQSNLEAKIGKNLHMQIRRKEYAEEEEGGESDFEWVIMMQEKIQYYSFK
ncbi:hypothetical protein FGO68_gene11005 [Halteria grandinella]|uniref:Uncharacterized protein n=1 Tax=Halteria grandinella TaxID=5974 RepID=A0A8J8NM38_HALGN|nr:hypothetical protein FGO68_gene11005 [Halteria grandinella]